GRPARSRAPARRHRRLAAEGGAGRLALRRRLQPGEVARSCRRGPRAAAGGAAMVGQPVAPGAAVTPESPGRICFCTLAIHAPYRQRARRLCQASFPAPWVVLTDGPEDFVDLPVRAVPHQPTGPMAVDYLQRAIATGDSNGAAAYHDKRFALQAALGHFD